MARPDSTLHEFTETERREPTAPCNYATPGRYTVAVKVIDIFGNDTMAHIPVSVG